MVLACWGEGQTTKAPPVFATGFSTPKEVEAPMSGTQHFTKSLPQPVPHSRGVSSELRRHLEALLAVGLRTFAAASRLAVSHD